MNIDLAVEQVAELESVAKKDRTPKVRIKALALLNLGDGRTVSEVATIFRTSRPSLYAWVAEYNAGGVDGLRVSGGRGRKARADSEEIRHYIQQSPRDFGVEQPRWTLAALAATVPCLKGFSPSGVLQALRRAGFRHRRGQPSLHSPDPDYEKESSHRPGVDRGS